MKKKKLLFRVSFFFIVLFLMQCNGKTMQNFSFGFSSREALIQETSDLLVKSRYDEKLRIALYYTLLSKNEFAEKVYPHLPEATQKNPMSIDDYWFMTGAGNSKGIEAFLSEFKNEEVVKFTTLGKPEKTKEYGPLIIYTDNKAIFEGSESGEKIFENLFSAIVCHKNGLCRLWTMSPED